jgi:hypothetical protein
MCGGDRGLTALEFTNMSGYDPANPFCVIAAPSPGVSAGNRGGLLRRTCYPSLSEAERESRNLPPGYSLSQITYGPFETPCLTSTDHLMAILSDLFRLQDLERI